MYPVKNVPEYDGMNYSMSSDKVPRRSHPSMHKICCTYNELPPVE